MVDEMGNPLANGTRYTVASSCHPSQSLPRCCRVKLSKELFDLAIVESSGGGTAAIGTGSVLLGRPAAVARERTTAVLKTANLNIMLFVVE
jgi:hypothetical protein